METKTALVLSGGGSLGAVQVGMLQALSRIELPIDMVIGTSVGALNGAFFAAAPTADGVERLADLWRGLRRRDIFPFTVGASLKAWLLRRDHLVDPGPLQALIGRALAIRRIEDTALPLSIVATDALSGAEVVLSSGDLEPALLASTAVPVAASWSMAASAAARRSPPRCAWARSAWWCCRPVPPAPPRSRRATWWRWRCTCSAC